VWLRQISFRSRVSLLVAAAVGVAIAIAALSTYVAVSHQLEQEVNNNLQNAVTEVPANTHIFGPNLDPRPFETLAMLTGDQVQVIYNNQGTQVASVQQAGFDPTDLVKVTAVAMKAYTSGNSAPIQTLQGSGGTVYRVATVSVIKGTLAVQILYPLTDLDHTLAFLRWVLILLALGGVALATTLGWAVGRASMGPVEDLTLAAEHVARTQDLSATIDDSGSDELARLARSFNAMLAALSASRHQQAQLVADAGHELRTPLTSLRTNIEVLMRAKDLAGPDREELLADVDAQLKELSTLVGDLVDLAREDERPHAEPMPVPFDEVVVRAVERAQRRAMSVHFDVSLEPGQVIAQPALLERAVMNVLDNAAKWSPPGGHVNVTLQANSGWHLTVSDQGPGIAPEDLPHIFERFYRAPTARSMPGSGLGLAIVKGVVTSHQGTIEVTPAPGGGTRVDIVLPMDPAPLAMAENGSPG
jgi:two-component system, OmpR family, sensor histidine kinase MprB